MSKMISVAQGFQYSVNIAYDINDSTKLQNFIPTKSALSLLEEIVLSASPSSTERARILIGAYGKGKSHIVLMILSVLARRDLSLFEKMLPAIKERPRLEHCIKSYYESALKLLPVAITGSSKSLSQSFIAALQRALKENGLLDAMPETNYKAAVLTIERWKRDFPKTYAAFEKAIGEPAPAFVDALSSYSAEAYEQFERLYPTLTAGSAFNPFLGFDAVELYESAAKSLKAKGYSGIYVVYDEFSKYLEANITDASISDIKMLQDFAEKCNRSGEAQLHLMLISHKEIANYIDKLPKQKVDGWRGVSERFKHIHLNNNFSQVYEIIANVIKKEPAMWSEFCAEHRLELSAVQQRYSSHPMFADSPDDLTQALYGCYPLHPVSTFILPRLSEKAAQNERTLFTFLSASGTATLSAFLASCDDASVEFATPDLIYDYFEPLFKKEAYDGDLYRNYILTENILTRGGGIYTLPLKLSL